MENGYVKRSDKVTSLVASDYLKIFEGSGIDTMILGCTHFPIIRDIISDMLEQDVTLINPGEETARYTAAKLTKEHILNDPQHEGSCRYYVSDAPESFSEYGSLFLGEQIGGHVEKIDIGQLPANITK